MSGRSSIAFFSLAKKLLLLFPFFYLDFFCIAFRFSISVLFFSGVVSFSRYFLHLSAQFFAHIFISSFLPTCSLCLLVHSLLARLFSRLFPRASLRRCNTRMPSSLPYKSASHPLQRHQPPSHHNISCTRLTLCYFAPVSHRVLLSRSRFMLHPVVHLLSVSIRVLIGN